MKQFVTAGNLFLA